MRWDGLVGDIYQVMFSVVCFEDDDDLLGELNGVVPPCMGRAVLALGNVHQMGGVRTLVLHHTHACTSKVPTRA